MIGAPLLAPVSGSFWYAYCSRTAPSEFPFFAAFKAAEKWNSEGASDIMDHRGDH